MNIKASGRAALIIAAGFWVAVSSPAQAAETPDGGVAAAQTEAAPGAPVVLSKFRKSRRWKHASSHREPVKLASRISAGPSRISESRVSRKTSAVDLALKEDDAAISLPASVANARAQLADADASSGSAAALTSQARNRLQLMAANQPAPATEAGLVEADQLNELDRALSETRTVDKAPAATEARADDKAPAATPAMAVAPPPAAAASTDDSSWGQASLIGKIFIAFGGLLTLASAARMFMA